MDSFQQLWGHQHRVISTGAIVSSGRSTSTLPPAIHADTPPRHGALSSHDEAVRNGTVDPSAPSAPR